MMTQDKMEMLVNIIKHFNKFKNEYIESYFHPELNGCIIGVLYDESKDKFRVYTTGSGLDALEFTSKEAASIIIQHQYEKTMKPSDREKLGVESPYIIRET